MKSDSAGRTILVAFVLCVVCSILVSGAAVVLRPKQMANKALDVQKNLLLAAGLLTDSKATPAEVTEAYKVIDAKVINLETGLIEEGIEAAGFDEKKAAKDPKMSYSIASGDDKARIKNRSKYSRVFLVKENGQISMVVLPVFGKGLWSTMYGFLALAPDTKHVKGFGFYEHGETPGLGGEVDNSKWKKSWIGKSVLDESFKPILDVVKGSVNTESSDASHQIDGLSGATITSNGVEATIHYWLGQNGFGPFLAKFREGAIQ
jgi:Na+-transporting NADH:ubiquinone oxidoreductase subunit C